MSPLILLLLVVTISSVFAANVTVTIENGQIRGRTETTARGKSFYAFERIPYAKPPTGTLRFKAPVPVGNWSGVLDAASATEVVCYQAGANTTGTQTEDCLYVNVYTSAAPGTDAGLPVIYYIFGGGFLNGKSTFYGLGPHYFVERDVIIVTVNYRIGPFGFLSTGDTVIPGNYGLKDQSLGLKWVQNNIKYFGGDPTKVTLMGESAGGASVTYQTLSKQSSGLFRAAIANSGSALCPWAYQRFHKEIAYGVANGIDPSFNSSASSEELLTFLQNATPEQINNNAFHYQVRSGYDQIIQGFEYAPVIEPQHESAFITEEMYTTISKGVPNLVPLLIGIASEEQISRASDLSQFINLVQYYEQSPSLLVNDNMHLTDSGSISAAASSIHQIYSSDSFTNNLAAAVKFFSDTSFSRPIIHHARLQSQFGDVYFYEFSYHGALGGNNIYVEGADRVQHSEDMSYMWAWGNNSNMDANAPSDVLTSNRFITLFTNFAKTLNPTPETSSILDNIVWPKATPTNFQYLNFNDTLQIQKDPKNDAYQGWVNVYETIAIKPYDTF